MKFEFKVVVVGEFEGETGGETGGEVETETVVKVAPVWQLKTYQIVSWRMFLCKANRNKNIYEVVFI